MVRWSVPWSLREQNSSCDEVRLCSPSENVQVEIQYNCARICMTIVSSWICIIANLKLQIPHEIVYIKEGLVSACEMSALFFIL
jgi:hypothetical protein